MAGRADGRDVQDLLRVQIGAHLGLGHGDLRSTAGHDPTLLRPAQPLGGRTAAAAQGQVGLGRTSSCAMPHSAASTSGDDASTMPSGPTTNPATAERHRLGERRPRERARRQRRSSIAANSAAGKRRPRPATNHTGTSLQYATDATARDGAATTTSSGPAASASTSTRSAATAAAAAPEGGTISASMSARCKPADERRPFVVGVDREHPNVTAAHDRVADEVGPTHHAHRGVVGQCIEQVVGRRVVLDLGQPARMPR